MPSPKRLQLTPDWFWVSHNHVQADTEQKQAELYQKLAILESKVEELEGQLQAREFQRRSSLESINTMLSADDQHISPDNIIESMFCVKLLLQQVLVG